MAAPGVCQQLGQLRSWELEAAAHQLDGLVVVEQLLQDEAAVQVHAGVPGLQRLPGKYLLFHKNICSHLPHLVLMCTRQGTRDDSWPDSSQ